MSAALAPVEPASAPVVWVVEVLTDGVWTLRNGPLPTYDQARWCINERMLERNNWRIRGGPTVMDTVVEPTLNTKKKRRKKKS